MYSIPSNLIYRTTASSRSAMYAPEETGWSMCRERERSIAVVKEDGFGKFRPMENAWLRGLKDLPSFSVFNPVKRAKTGEKVENQSRESIQIRLATVET
jgi:hypothetical protein